MEIWRQAVLVALGVLLLGASEPAIPPDLMKSVPVTLDDAIARGIKTNPLVVQSSGSVRIAAAARRRSFGAYLPTLSATASGSYASNDRFDTATNTVVVGANQAYRAGLSSTWDVFTAGRRGADSRQTEANANAADAQLLSDRANVALLVEQAFYDALRAKELAGVSLARVQRAEEGLGAADRRMKVGTATRSDVLRAQLEMNSARQSLLQQRADYRAAAFALGRLIGIDQAAEPTAEPSEAIAPADVAEEEKQVAALIETAPAVKAAEAQAVAAEASVWAARSRYFPTARLSAGYDWFNQEFSPTGIRKGWSVQLGLSYPIFDGFLREENVERASVAAMVAAAESSDAKRAIRADAERSIGQVRLARERVALAQQAVQVSREDLRVLQDRYRLGVATMLDLITSQTNLVEAENNLVTSRFDYQLAKAEFTALAGRPL